LTQLEPWARFYKQNRIAFDSFAITGGTQAGIIHGEGKHYGTYFRMYDSDIGRWWGTDPIIHPFQTPYNAFDNNPVLVVDPNGADGQWTTRPSDSPDGVGQWQEDPIVKIEKAPQWLIDQRNAERRAARQAIWEEEFRRNSQAFHQQIDSYMAQFNSESRFGFELVPYVDEASYEENSYGNNNDAGVFAYNTLINFYNGPAFTVNYGIKSFFDIMSGVDPASIAIDDGATVLANIDTDLLSSADLWEGVASASLAGGVRNSTRGALKKSARNATKSVEAEDVPISIRPITLTTSSKSNAPSRVYSIYDGQEELYKFGVTDANLGRFGQSIKQAGPGAYGKYSQIMPKYQAHIMEKYLRSLHFHSTGVWRLDGMKIPYPVDFDTGLPIKP